MWQWLQWLRSFFRFKKKTPPRCQLCFRHPHIIHPMDYAIIHDHLACFQQAHLDGCEWSIGITCQAAMYGRLDILKYAHDNGCPWDEGVCTYSAKHDRLDCLQYAHENGCPWDEHTLLAAAYGGSKDCYEYAHMRGCPDPMSNPELTKMTKLMYEITTNEILEYMKEHPVICGVCVRCSLDAKDFCRIPWTEQKLWYFPFCWKYLKARAKLIRAMEHAHWNPNYIYCLNRLHNDYMELMGKNDTTYKDMRRYKTYGARQSNPSHKGCI